MQALAAADDDVGPRPHLAGLVIGHAQVTADVALDEIDRAAQLQPAGERNRIGGARRVGVRAVAIDDAER